MTPLQIVSIVLIPFCGTLLGSASALFLGEKLATNLFFLPAAQFLFQYIYNQI